METETAIDSEYPNSNGHDQAAAQVEQEAQAGTAGAQFRSPPMAR